MKLKPAMPPKNSNYGVLNLPILQSAVNELVRNLKFPLPMVQWIAISIACSVLQGLVRVRNPRGFIDPVSIYCLIVALSGEGKTAAEGVLRRGITRFEAAERERHQAAVQAYKEAMQLFDVKRRALESALCREIKGEGDEEGANEALATHVRTRPARPKEFRPFMEYVTPEAWIKVMAENIPVTSLYSSEAGAIMSGRTFDKFEFLNQAWGGGPLSVDTKKDGHLNIPWCRMAMGLMIQPGPLERLLAGKGQKGMENGFFARTVVCVPESTQGSRFVHDGTLSWEHCNAFSDRTEQFLNQTANKVRQEGYEPVVLEFSPEAAALFLEINNSIEEQNCQGGRYECARDHATKLPSNIARVAAVLHYFEGFGGKISIETLNAARILCEDSSLDYLEHFSPLPQVVQDAILLDKNFDELRCGKKETVLKNDARRGCPGVLRKDKRFYRALDILVQEGIVKVFTDGTGTEKIILNPKTYSPFLYAGMPSF